MSAVLHRRAQSDAASAHNTHRRRASSIRAFWAGLVGGAAPRAAPEPEVEPELIISSPDTIKPTANVADISSSEGGEDDAMEDDDTDSIFSADDEVQGKPTPSAAHALVRELELGMDALALANAELRRRVALLRALLRRLTHDLHVARAPPQRKRTPSRIVLTHAASAGTSSTEAGELAHLAAALHASGIGPPTPSEAYFSTHSRSSSGTHPATDVRSLSSVPPTPVTPVTPVTKLAPSGAFVFPPNPKPGREQALAPTSPPSTRSSRILATKPGPKRPPAVIRTKSSLPTLQQPQPPRPPPAREQQQQQKRNSRVSVLSFLPSRGSTVRPPAAPFKLAAETSQARPSLHIQDFPSPPSSPPPTLSSLPRASMDVRTRIPTLTNIRSSARKLRDTFRRRSNLPPVLPMGTSSAH
jgi:hypothetical protein